MSGSSTRWVAAATCLIGFVGVMAPVPEAMASTAPTSAKALSAVTVSYGSDPLQTIDIYPGRAPNAKVVIMIPGSGWRSGINMNMEVMAARNLQSDGYAVFDMSFRGDSSSAPAFPMETDDVRAATAYAAAHAATYNADAAKVILLGGSSGAQLAAYATLQMNTASHHFVSLVVTLSGPSDFPTLIAYWNARTGPDAALHLGNQLDALGCQSASTCPTALENQWSADRQVTPANCPANWLVFNSSAEEMPVQQADAMTAALKAAGCKVTESILGGNKHGFHSFKSLESQIDAGINAA